MKSQSQGIVCGFVLGLVATALSLSAQENSHVRIVRLSFGEGTVSLQRPDVPDWSKAPVNTPIQEGYKLSTGKDSYAEVEFENGSTARVGENSLLEFRELSLAPSGSKVNKLELHYGYGTYHVTPQSGDVYEVKAGEVTLAPDGKAEFRADLDEETVRVEVFKGLVDVSGPGGSQKLTKNKVLEFQSGSDEAYNITHGITRDSWDEWVAERDQIQAQDKPPSVYSSQAGSTNYGWSDLNSYGSWSYLTGFGYGWIPDASFGWSPFTFGRWAWYPGFGYTWISYEPWGWLPYHYGNWFFDPVAGWAWFPGAFGNWCPAAVTWYQGNGWVGWSPRPVAGAGGQKGCSQAKGCVITVPVNTFQNGKAVTPATLLAVDSVSRPVPSPDVEPTRLAKLPGAPVPEAIALHAAVSKELVLHPTVSAAASTAFARPGPGSARALSFGSSFGNRGSGSLSGGRISSHSATRSSSAGSFSAGHSSAPVFSSGSSGGVSSGGGGSHSSSGTHH